VPVLYDAKKYGKAMIQLYATQKLGEGECPGIANVNRARTFIFYAADVRYH
jgi:hypothetical protein